jgi:hypothetical protein
MDDDHMSGPSRSATMGWMASTFAETVELAEAWTAQPALTELSARLGGPGRGATPAQLAKWSEQVLDTRAGAERHEAEPVSWSKPWTTSILAAAGPLGLLETMPPALERYDATMILGGTTLGNRLRMALAAGTIGDAVDLGTLILVTADRALTERELQEAAVDREWQHAMLCANEYFGPLAEKHLDAGGSGKQSWQDRTLSNRLGRTVRVLVAPASCGAKRATTADGIAFAMRRIPRGERHSILLITSAIYAPYQFFASAPLMLGRGVRRVELVGTATSTEGNPEVAAQRLAQETHAAIKAAATLVGQGDGRGRRSAH